MHGMSVVIFRHRVIGITSVMSDYFSLTIFNQVYIITIEVQVSNGFRQLIVQLSVSKLISNKV